MPRAPSSLFSSHMIHIDGREIRDRFDLSVDPVVVLRALKHMTVPVKLLRIQAPELHAAAVADEKRSEDDIPDI